MIEMLNNAANYAGVGFMHTAGYIPTGMEKSGALNMKFMEATTTMGSRSFGMGALAGRGAVGGVGGAIAGLALGADPGMAAMTGAGAAMMMSGLPKPGAISHTGNPLTKMSAGYMVNPAMSAYFLYQGYQEGGLAGARDTAVWDVATNAAFAKYGYHNIKHGSGLASTKVSRGFVGSSARFMGAAGGAAIGQALGQAVGVPGLGVAGAFVGGAMGAAPLRGSFAVLRHPVLMAGAAAVGGAYLAGRGTHAILKAGHAHGASKRGIQTSGDLAAFSTKGAVTMRARAVQAMHKSHLNARSALGQEASLMHHSGRNYHSRYR